MAGLARPSAAVLAAILRGRLAAVHACMVDVAAGPAAADEVHRLRVSVRRASAAIDLFRPFLPPKRRRWFKARLREVRRAAGEVRDLDIVVAGAKRHRGGSGPRSAIRLLAAEAARRRSGAGESLMSLVGPSAQDDWQRHARRVLAAVEEPRSSAFIAKRIRRRLRSLIARFLARADRPLRRGRGLHRLRIAGKRLRYAVEAAAEVVPLARAAESDRMLRRIQERFGTYTDRAAIVATLRHWALEVSDPDGRRELVAVRREASRQARRAKHRCARWWTSARRDRFRHRLAKPFERRTA